jgi:hypothetical protein
VVPGQWNGDPLGWFWMRVGLLGDAREGMYILISNNSNNSSKYCGDVICVMGDV